VEGLGSLGIIFRNVDFRKILRKFNNYFKFGWYKGNAAGCGDSTVALNDYESIDSGSTLPSGSKPDISTISDAKSSPLWELF
jgi:hypothetical protein